MDAYVFIKDIDLRTLDALAEVPGVRFTAPTIGDHAVVLAVETDDLEGLHDVIDRVREAGATGVSSAVASPGSGASALLTGVTIPPIPIPIVARAEKDVVVAFALVATAPGDTGLFLSGLGRVEGVVGATALAGGKGRYLLELSGPDVDSVVAAQERVRMLAGNGEVTLTLSARSRTRGGSHAS